jgi:hypothetical protein
MRPSLLLVTVLTLLVAAPAASAATGFTLGTGLRPAIGMSSDDGTAHVVWLSQTSSDDTTVYCRVPRGATSCDRTTTLTPGGTAVTNRPFIVMRSLNKFTFGGPGGAAGGFSAPIYAVDSNDRGATFGASRRIGDFGLVNDQGQSQQPYAIGPGAAVSAVAGNVGLVYQRMPTDGSPGATARAVLTSDLTTQPTVGVVGTTPVVAWDNGSDTSYRRYSGSGDIHNAANWTTAVTLPGEVNPRLVSGSGGLALLTNRGSEYTLLARRFDGTGFGGAPTVVAERAQEVNGAQTDSGQLVIVYRHFGVPYRIKLVRSTDAAFTTFTAPVDIVREGDEGIIDLQLALAADGQGLVVWRRFPGTEIRAATLDPIVDPPAPPSGPPAGPPPSGPGPTRPPAGGGSRTPAERTVSTLVGATDVQFSVPRSCVRPGARFTARVVTADRQRLVGRRARVRATQVDFLVDRVRKARDKKKPFRASLATRGLRAGSHTVTARISLRRLDRPRTTSVKTLTATIRTC